MAAALTHALGAEGDRSGTPRVLRSLVSTQVLKLRTTTSQKCEAVLRVSKVHRHVYHPALGWGVIKKKRRSQQVMVAGDDLGDEWGPFRDAARASVAGADPTSQFQNSYFPEM